MTMCEEHIFFTFLLCFPHTVDGTGVGSVHAFVVIMISIARQMEVNFLYIWQFTILSPIAVPLGKLSSHHLSFVMYFSFSSTQQDSKSPHKVSGFPTNSSATGWTRRSRAAHSPLAVPLDSVSAPSLNTTQTRKHWSWESTFQAVCDYAFC